MFAGSWIFLPDESDDILNKNKFFKPLGLHSLECHEYHMKTWGRCPYCNVGSRPVTKCVIVEKVNK